MYVTKLYVSVLTGYCKITHDKRDYKRETCVYFGRRGTDRGFGLCNHSISNDFLFLFYL
jgi:hypothetical protein